MAPYARIVSAVVILWLSFGSLVRAQELPLKELEVDHALTCDFPTPHTDWAQPYALGKTRVLFFTNGMGTSPRECVELIQRFDLDAQAVFWSQIVDSPQTHWHGGKMGEQRMFRLLQEKWDCFVFLQLKLEQMAPREQYLLLKAVADGAGLVLVDTSDPRVFKDKNRLKSLPPLLASGPVGEAYTIGKGRGMRLPRRPGIPYREGWQTQDDYWHERVGRAVLWAAGKEPKCQLDVSLSKTQFTPDEPKRVAVRLSGAPIGQRLMLHVSVRRPADLPLVLPAAQVSVGSKSGFLLPRLAAGDYHVDARLVGSAGVETWATLPFTVKSDRTVASVDLAQDWGEIGQRIKGSVRLQGNAGQNDVVRVSLLDRRRRELVRRDVRPTGNEIAFDFAIEPWMPMLVTVEAQLRCPLGEIARASSYFRVTKRHRGQFNFVMWDFPRGTLAPYAEESLAKHAVTLQLQGEPKPPTYLAAFDVAYIPYTTRIMAPKSPEGIMRPFCWNDREAVNKHVSDLAKKYVPSRQHGVFAYSLGDENDTLGCCLSPHCLKAYRQYLQETYGTLDALNKSWGTAWKQWDDIGLSKPDDNEETTAREQGNYPRWFDRQAFKSYNYVKYCEKYAAAFDAIDPQAKTGFEGAGGFARGDDLDLIVRRLKFWSPYPGTADEVIRSIAPRAMPRANWMGYTKDADSLLAKYWRMVTRGSDAVWWWRWDCIGAFHGWLAPDLRPYPAVKEILEDTQCVRDGLGDLLLQSQMQDDRIALLYSYPSVFAHKLADGSSFGGYESAHLAIHQTLRDQGLQFRYVTDRMLRLGEFDAAHFKLLILPRTEAIGDREAQVIRKFVANGGTLLADVRPGLYDDHCKPRAQGVLDDLFGITRAAASRAKTVRQVTTAGPQRQSVLAHVVADPGVKVSAADAVTKLASAEALPLCIARPVGKGKAVLLNFAAGSLPKPGAGETPEAAAEFFRTLWAECGVRPALTVRDASGKRIPNVEVIRWTNGSQQIVALFRQEGQTQPATVELSGAQPRYVYDLRQRKPLGPAAKFATTIAPNRATFLVLTEKPAPAPRLVVTKSPVARGQVVKGLLSVPETQGLHAFRIRARLGDHEFDWLDRVLVAGERPKEFDIPIAFNDPAGQYTITATDLLTNGPTAATLLVLPGERSDAPLPVR